MRTRVPEREEAASCAVRRPRNLLRGQPAQIIRISRHPVKVPCEFLMKRDPERVYSGPIHPRTDVHPSRDRLVMLCDNPERSKYSVSLANRPFVAATHRLAIRQCKWPVPEGY